MSLEKLFLPESIVIVGASRKEGSLGRVFFDNVRRFGYKGRLYPINPKAPEIGGIPCYSSISALPETPDVAVILVRKERALETVEECGRKGIENIIMITAGFREVGGEGIEREKALLELVRKYNLRLVGPNCMGIINTDPEVRLNASFSPTEPYTGNVAFVSQSGALGVAVLEMSKELRLGFSIFVSAGNKADLNDNDFLEFLASHEPTRVVTLYQESIEEVDRFRKITSRLSRKKPLIVVKAGRSQSGAQAASSHTGALASSDTATEALFKQCGIIRADSIAELFDLSLAFSSQPIPRGDGIAVITNAGGPGILAADAIELNRLRLVKLSEETRRRLRSFLPEEASVHNPVDMIASANEDTYQNALQTVLQDPGVDAIMVIIVRPPVNTTPRMIVEKFRSVLKNGKKKPVFVVLMAQHDDDCGLEVFQELRLPVYSYPEAAASAIAKMVEYGQRRRQPAGKLRKFSVDKGSLRHIFEQAITEKREYLRSNEVTALLDAYGFPLPFSKIIQSPDEALEIFEQRKTPLVLKIESDDIIHKSDVGGVKIGLDTPLKIRQAYQELMDNALQITRAERIQGVFLQEMVTAESEVALGMKKDPNYGPLLMFGMGGVFIEVFQDVSFRLAPITDQDARQMVEETRAAKILKGYRGSSGVNLDLVIETLQRLSQLVLDWPQILEMDLNPFLLSSVTENCKIVDARIRIQLGNE